jgi:hypothetical protein
MYGYITKLFRQQAELGKGSPIENMRSLSTTPQVRRYPQGLGLLTTICKATM